MNRNERYEKSPKGRERHVRYSQKLRRAALEHYGGAIPTCACPNCKETRTEFLAIDHIGGGGNQHRRDIGPKGGTGFFLWLQRNGYPKGFRVLCHNCNAAHGLYGYCPHDPADCAAKTLFQSAHA